MKKMEVNDRQTITLEEASKLQGNEFYDFDNFMSLLNVKGDCIYTLPAL